ncbi:Pre-mRNA-splicing factor SNT309, partial [Frankliniella fusca]
MDDVKRPSWRFFISSNRWNTSLDRVMWNRVFLGIPMERCPELRRTKPDTESGGGSGRAEERRVPSQEEGNQADIELNYVNHMFSIAVTVKNFGATLAQLGQAAASSVLYEALADLLPSQIFNLIQDSALGVMLAGVDLLEGVVDDVQTLRRGRRRGAAPGTRTLFPERSTATALFAERSSATALLPERSSDSSVRALSPQLSSATALLFLEQASKSRTAPTSLHVRALRQRYQHVLDAVKMNNRVYGGLQLIALPSMLAEAVVCLYAWLVIVVFSPSGPADWTDVPTLVGVSGITTVLKILFICYIGEHVSTK